MNPEYEKSRKRIIEIVDQQCKMLGNDISTFQFVRESGQLSKIPELGGGNILSLNGLFAVVNLIAKIHYAKMHTKSILSPKEIAIIREEIKTLKKQNPKIKQYIMMPKNININESVAFRELITDSDIDLGIEHKDLQNVWDKYRNGLAHYACQKGQSSAVACDAEMHKITTVKVTPALINEFFNARNDKSFVEKDGWYFCLFDFFKRDVLFGLKEFILKEIEAATYEELDRICYIMCASLDIKILAD
ncbi:MAG: hypothetical protein WC536_01130 [Patescibacteria group bacterium]